MQQHYIGYPPSKKSLCNAPVRPHGHDFTLLDYSAYLNKCRVLMQQKRLRAALLRGGYLWRVALSAMYFDDVLDGPSGLSSNEDDMFSVMLPNGKRYVDDDLTEEETNILLGTYACKTGNALLPVKYEVPSTHILSRLW